MSLALSPFPGPSTASAGSQLHPLPFCLRRRGWKWQDQQPDTEVLFLGGRMASSVWWELEAGAAEGPQASLSQVTALPPDRGWGTLAVPSLGTQEEIGTGP